MFSLLFAWFNLPKVSLKKTPPSSEQNETSLSKTVITLPLILLASAYFLYGIGFTPHTLFIVDYIVRVLHGNNHLAGSAWSLFGIGTVVGTISIGFIADRFGVTKCLIIVYGIATLAIGLLLAKHNIIFTMISSLIMGTLFLSIVSLSSAQLSEFTAHKDYPFLWGLMTTLFALSQTISAYGISYMVENSNNYTLVFSVALLSLILATALMFALKKILNKRDSFPLCQALCTRDSETKTE